ncbi:MAG: aspartate kinase [Clostridia bacterium]|nr:aspartate kinase [Clostridia bacterium]
MGIVVQKFGGSSLDGPKKIKNVARRVIECSKAGNQVVTVVSALGDTTDKLIELGTQVAECQSRREMDMLLSTGEQVSIALLAMAIKDMGYEVISLTGAQAGILTDKTHTKAKIIEINPERLSKELDEGKIVITAGFQGITNDNEITTLGRGGSDITAVAISAALRADVCEIFTDVEGVYTTDPRMIPEARKLAVVTYDEMLELASLGAGVLQPRSVEFAKIHNVILHVRSSFNHRDGTIVREDRYMDNNCQMEKDVVVTGVAYDLNTARIGLFDVPDRPGVAHGIFTALSRENINVDMIVQGAMRNGRNDISFTAASEDIEKVLEIMKPLTETIGISKITCDRDVSKVSIVGAGMITNPGVAAAMFEALAEEEINIHMISTSEIKVSCIINKGETERAVASIHKKFNLDKTDQYFLGRIK